jgi:hypothetical protein
MNKRINKLLQDLCKGKEGREESKRRSMIKSNGKRTLKISQTKKRSLLL